MKNGDDSARPWAEAYLKMANTMLAHGMIFIDPEVATGFDYTVGGNKFRLVMVPAPLPNGQKTFELVVDGQTFPLEAGVPFDLTTVSADGVSAFTIRGINVSEKLDPNPTAFVTGLTFMNPSSPADVKMTPIVTVVGNGLSTRFWLPIGGTLGLSLIGGLGFWGWRRKKTL